MSHPTHYELRVARFEDRRAKSRASDFYVKVALVDVVQKTQTSKTRNPPTWDDRLTFSSSDASAMFSIRVKEKLYKGLSGDVVGDASISISKLLEECACGEAQLKVLSRSKKGSGSPVGDIYVYLKDVDVQERVGIDFENVRESVKRIDRSASYADCAVNNIASLVLKLDEVVKAVDAAVQIHTYLNLTWQITSVLYKVVRHQLMVDQKLVELVKLMQETFCFASDVKTLSDKTQKIGQGFKDVLVSTNECCRFVQQYTKLSFTERALKINSDRRIDSFCERFCDVKKQIDSGVALHIAFQVDSIVTTQQLEALEKLLEPNKSDTSERARCLAGTRTGYLEYIKSWIISDTTPNILWINGIAGSGKSTIAATIMDHCDDRRQLAAFLFFQRGKEEHKSTIRSIAYQLAAFHPPIARQVCTAAEQLRNITGALKGPTVIILDALDECGSVEQRREILELLRIEFSKLPLRFRFLVTSRPEDDIMTALSKGHIDTLKLDPASVDGRCDVDAYIDSAMRKAVTQPVPDNWDWGGDMKILKVAANGLFIWASTAVKMVSTNDDQFEQLQAVIQDIRSVNGLDGLYATVLRQSEISWGNHTSRDRFRKVLGLVLFGKQALSDEVIDNILGLPRGKARLTLQRLRSVLSYESGQPIRLHHASFADYLLSPDRCGGDPWFIEANSERKYIATRCFDVMEMSLRFNICKLQTSFVRNDEVEGLQNRINANIPQHLLYACRFWAEHVCQLQQTVDLAEMLDKLKTFSRQYLLYWFEVLSLTKDFSRIAVRALHETSLWTASTDAEISSFLWSAYRLASVFAYPISQSTPHIYHSALPLWKGESRVADHYSTTHPVVPVYYVGNKSSEPCIKVLRGHTHYVWSVAFSPNGKRVVSGSQDETIRIWDADAGELVPGPFTDHTGPVSSVAFSPDGKRVVSGSDDRTIRIWDTDTGELVSGPFTGHTGSVWSVAFSPDGKRVVSGSFDQTIRIWDADTGELVSGPFAGHTGYIWSVAFSPDGKRVVSGSDDQTIRIWDANTGELVPGPFTGYTGSVLSVAFSPDGKRVVSGSFDQTIRIWDADTGELVSGPFAGHTGYIWSVAFSPDGKRVVSGSDDQTIRIWDADTGELVSGPFTGHTGSVRSVAFSPDGKRVVSGSYDQTIRIWDADTGELVSGPFTGHTDSVRSVAFSPDGKRVVSGSYDQTIRIWDADTGELVSGPFTGHTDSVRSVAFSPDGKRVVSGSYGQTIRIWDADTGELVSGPFTGHTGSVRSVAFSPDGKRVVSGSDDRTIRIWNSSKDEAVSTHAENRQSSTSRASLSSPVLWRTNAGSSEQDVGVLGLGRCNMVPALSKSRSFSNWTMSDDGWVLGDHGELLIWIPEGIRGNLWRSENTAVFSIPYVLKLDFSDCPLGENWCEGFPRSQ